MAEYAEIKTAEGDVVLFEVDDHDGPVPAGRLRKTVDRSQETLQEGIDRAKQVASSVVKSMTELEQPPGRIEVEIGLKVTAEANFAVAKSSSEAQIKIVMEWSDLKPATNATEPSYPSIGNGA